MLDKIDDLSKVRLASIHLEEGALPWYQAFLKNLGNVMPSWAEYVPMIELIDDPMIELKELKQNASV